MNELCNDPRELREINEQYSRFWSKHSKLTNRLILNPRIFRLATADMQSEVNRQVPIKSQKSLTQALMDAAGAMNVQREFARMSRFEEFFRKGGRAPKGDALQHLIEEIIVKRPKINHEQLVCELAGPAGAGVVVKIDKAEERLAGIRQIHFVNENRKPKSAPISGLKHRLRRAKKKIKSASKLAQL